MRTYSLSSTCQLTIQQSDLTKVRVDNVWHQRGSLIVLFTALALLAWGPARADFIPLGDLPGGTFFSLANGVSADGSVVVGRGTSALGSEAFIWDG